MNYVDLFTDIVIVLIIVIGIIVAVAKISNAKKLEQDFEEKPKEMFSEFIPIITTVLNEAKAVIDNTRDITDLESYKHQLATTTIRLIANDYDDELFENEKLSRIARIVTEETLIKGLESLFDICDGTFDAKKLFQDYLNKKEKDLDDKLEDNGYEKKESIKYKDNEELAEIVANDLEGDTEDSE